MRGRLRHLVCGSTSHDIGALFRDTPHARRDFPSGVFLYDAADGSRILFDTGYAPGRWRTGWRGVVYRRLLPPHVVAADDVAARLADIAVEPASITHVVLSHLHPDHVGGVRRFPDATFVVTQGLERTLAEPTLRSGVLTGLLPDWFATCRRLVVAEGSWETSEVGGVPLRTRDLLGDGSYRIVDLPGHADGHLGALVEGRVLLAGDAAWGSDLLAKVPDMRALPRAVQHDAERYEETARLLAEAARGGIRVVCSHDPVVDEDLLV